MSKMNDYLEKSLEEYGPNKLFLFDKYFWMSLFGIPIKDKDNKEEDYPLQKDLIEFEFDKEAIEELENTVTPGDDYFEDI